MDTLALNADGSKKDLGGMKQRVRVVGIIRNGDEFLMLKRNLGRMESAPIWELPTGKIKFGEQPEEAMTRAIYEYLGVEVESVKLADATTFVSLGDTSQLYNLFVIYEVTIKQGSKLEPRDRYTSFRYVKFDEATANMRVDDASKSVLEIEMGHGEHAAEYRGAANGATVYTDGASRGNPGPAGIGYVIIDENGDTLKHGGEFIGFATSRVAEYFALKEGCEQAIQLGLKSVRFVSDNLMLVNQMNGIYQIKNQDLVEPYHDIQELLKNFDAVAFVHVKRDQNAAADAEANIAIDRHFDEQDTDSAIENK